MQSKKEIEHVVDSINTKYRSLAKRDVIEYEEVNEFTFHQRVALWRVADIQLITVLREGYNPSPLEFIATHKYVYFADNLLIFDVGFRTEVVRESSF